MFQLIVRNWGLKLLSLTFALLLWLFVMGEQKAEVGYTVPLELKNLPVGLVVANEVPSLVDVRISGPRTLLSNIQSSALSMSVDLQGLQAGLTTFKRLDQNLNIPSALRVSRLSPSYVEVKLERIRQKNVPVRVTFNGQLANGATLESVVVRPESVMIEGAESEVKDVDSVETEAIDVTLVQESFTLTLPIEYRGTYTELKDQKTVEVEVVILNSNSTDIGLPEVGAEVVPQESTHNN
ncbi:MAG: YbbR domain pair protein [Desulfobacteraceae bacterium 4572_35.2]|nr:MAG: YbbR domain pair protein [Desulfobacteraceae bacterium 4572_35.2]